MAANILGPRPQAVPKKGSVKPLTYNDLRTRHSSIAVRQRAWSTWRSTSRSTSVGVRSPAARCNGAQILPSIGTDALFLHSAQRQAARLLGHGRRPAVQDPQQPEPAGRVPALPLFDPPIDPALLVRAAAAGLDVSAIVSGLNQPLPLVRFQLLVAKATEICQEVKSLGANLLAALEKQDNESLVAPARAAREQRSSRSPRR